MENPPLSLENNQIKCIFSKDGSYYHEHKHFDPYFCPHKDKWIHCPFCDDVLFNVGDPDDHWCQERIMATITVYTQEAHELQTLVNVFVSENKTSVTIRTLYVYHISYEFYPQFNFTCMTTRIPKCLKCGLYRTLFPSNKNSESDNGQLLCRKCEVVVVGETIMAKPLKITQLLGNELKPMFKFMKKP